MVYTSDIQSYCGLSGLDSCSAAVSSVPWDPGNPVVFYAIAAFPVSQPRLKAIAFAVDYDSTKFVLLNRGSCADFEITGTGWPAPGTGTSLTWSAAQTNRLCEVYYFVGYGYSELEEDSTAFSLLPHPQQGGVFVDDAFPAAVDTIAGYGVLGFGQSGERPCPAWTPDPGGSYEPPPADEVSVQFADGTLSLPPESRGNVPLSFVTTTYPGLLDTLETLGAVGIRRFFPERTRADTLSLDIFGNPVRLLDLTGYHVVTFSDEPSALAAVPTLALNDHVLSVEHIPAGIPVSSDTYWDYWPCQPVHYNAEWFMDNQGIMSGYGNCQNATSGSDIGVFHNEVWWPLPEYYGRQITIACVDVGVRDDHGDLEALNKYLSLSERQLIESYPETSDFCGAHGTRMAGYVAATADNEIGIAGVCSFCNILDLYSPNAREDYCSQPEADRQCESVYVGAAAEHIDHSVLVDACPFVYNLEFAGSSSSGIAPCIEGLYKAIWNRYKEGRVSVAPSSDQNTVTPMRIGPADVPFVLGVGGATWDDRFWARRTSCSVNDTVPVFAQPGTGVGPGVVSICAPASGTMVSLHHLPNAACDSVLYASGEGKCSSACALVAGVAGYLQEAANMLEPYGSWLTSDDLMGIIEASARPFSENPLITTDCAACTREVFGPGIVDVGSAIELVRMRWSGHWYERTAKKGDPFVLSWQRQDRIVHPDHFYYLVSTITAEVQLSQCDDAELPPFCGWVRRIPSRSYEEYFDWIPQQDEGHGRLNWDLAEEGVTGCSMGMIDQTTGIVRITGCTYGRRHPTDPPDVYEWVNGLEPDSLQMKYVCAVSGSAGVDEASAIEEATDWRVLRVRADAGDQWSIQYRAGTVPQAELVVFDTVGRQRARVRSLDASPGVHEVRWRAASEDGRALPSGVYFLRPKDGPANRSVKVIHIH